MAERSELWYVLGTDLKRRGVTRTPEPPPAPEYTPHFVGDPGEGEYYVGWACGPNGNTTLSNILANNEGATTSWNASKAVLHDYSGNSSGVQFSKIDAGINADMIPSQSFKMPAYSTSQIIAGSADAAITTLAEDLLARDPWPIWLCYFHEPEDDFTGSTNMSNYRAAYRRICTRVAAEGVTNVAWMPIYMNPYTFNTMSGRDWRNWHADWTGSTWNDDILMNLIGMDTYCPLPWNMNEPPAWYNATRNFFTYEQLWTSALAKIETPGYPEWDYVIPEFGMSNAFATDPDWEEWCFDAVTFSQQNRIKAFIYWDNSNDLGRWSFTGTYPAPTPNPDANGTKILGWEYIIENAVVGMVS